MQKYTLKCIKGTKQKIGIVYEWIKFKFQLHESNKDASHWYIHIKVPFKLLKQKYTLIQ
jgi:hypothetical protein